jgi:hypothetical protein
MLVLHAVTSCAWHIGAITLLLQFLAAEKKHPEEGEPLNVPVPPAPSVPHHSQ